MKSVDVLTIGAGGGAYPAGFRLAKSGKNVVMVDPKGVMSGNCLAEGCVPSKSMRESIELYRLSKKADFFGLNGELKFDYEKIIKHKDYVQRLRYDQHAEELKEASDHLQLVKGVASFVDDHVVEVQMDNGRELYKADHIIIASGEEISTLPVKGAELCVTSHDIFALNPNVKTFPSSMTIIGAGYIALETATFFNELGTRVHVLGRRGILTSVEPGLSEKSTKLIDPKIKIEIGTKIKEIRKNGNGYKVLYEKDGKDYSTDSDLVMMAVGRKALLPNGIDKLGIKVNEKGRIVVNSAMQTNIPHIYACGDVNGIAPFFHAAVRESLVAANNILGGDKPLDYLNHYAIPATVFTFPKISYVGIMPSIAQKMGIEIAEADYQFKIDSRAQIYGDMDGEIREFFDVKTMKIIGAWVIGIDADSLIGELGTAVANGLNVKQISEFADQHPMTSEGISKAARKLL